MSDKEKTNGSLAMAPRVITIPAANQETARKLRVAAYTRVSSNSKDQEHSFAAQNAYFSKLITDNSDWELADIYADQGITGTSIDKRDDFLRMMEDCRKGRIDRILVKSSSRFARNTKESLAAVRELKSLNISVYFEEQNIDTAQVSGEVLIAMFAALAQRESEAISERVRWSYKVRMSKGRFSTCKAPYGYRLVKDHLEIQEDEASIIRPLPCRCQYGEYCKGNHGAGLSNAGRHSILAVDLHPVHTAKRKIRRRFSVSKEIYHTQLSSAAKNQPRRTKTVSCDRFSSRNHQ